MAIDLQLILLPVVVFLKTVAGIVGVAGLGMWDCLDMEASTTISTTLNIGVEVCMRILIYLC